MKLLVRVRSIRRSHGIFKVVRCCSCSVAMVTFEPASAVHVASQFNDTSPTQFVLTVVTQSLVGFYVSVAEDVIPSPRNYASDTFKCSYVPPSASNSPYPSLSSSASYGSSHSPTATATTSPSFSASSSASPTRPSSASASVSSSLTRATSGTASASTTTSPLPSQSSLPVPTPASCTVSPTPTSSQDLCAVDCGEHGDYHYCSMCVCDDGYMGLTCTDPIPSDPTTHHCFNHVKDADESDIDCGGMFGQCQPCWMGMSCTVVSSHSGCSAASASSPVEIVPAGITYGDTVTVCAVRVPWSR